MNYNHLFPDKEITFEYYMMAIKGSLIAQPVFACRTNIEAGVEALSTLHDDERTRKLIDTSIVIDKNLTEPYSKKNDLFHKVPVFMTAISLVGNHYDDIKDLSAEQLAVLSIFSCVIDEKYMSDHLKMFANRELLQSVIDKTTKWREQSIILGVVEDRYFDFGIDKKDEVELNNFRNEMTSFVNNSSKEELLAMQKPIEVIWEELANSGLRI